jgi:hypothetical protein
MTRQEQIEQLETQNHELRSTLDNIAKKLDKLLDNISLREQNETFAKRIETLEAMLANKSESDAATVAVSSVPTPAAPATKVKVPFQALVLSDSMLRHVGGDCPIKRGEPLNRPTPSRRALIQDIKYRCSKSHPKIDIKKICVPGARAPRLFQEALSVAQDFSFEAVYVHVGTNSLCDTYNGDIVAELVQFLRALKGIFGCAIIFSFILPRITVGDRYNESRKLSRESVHQIEAIRYINEELLVFCNVERFDTLICDEFVMDEFEPCPDMSMLARDGCYLSRKGVVAMESALYDSLQMRFF